MLVRRVVVGGLVERIGRRGGRGCGGEGIAALLVFAQQCVDGDCARRLARAALGYAIAAAVHRGAELVGKTVHLRLELHDARVVALVERLDELADLIHLHPQIGAQHNQVVEAVPQNAPVRGDDGVAVRLVEFGENPRQIACGVVDLHLLPIGDRGDRGAGEDEITVGESAVHRARGERP